ncbi:MAG: hypothetical protein QXY49_04760 [Thermofilaceae archaeon]
MMSETIFKCSNCGGPLNYTPETIACVCEYCGTVNWFGEGRFDIFILPTRTRNEVINAFWSRMRNDPDMRRVYQDIELIEVQGFYVPILVGEVLVKGEWTGFKRVVEKKGKSYVTRTVTKSGSFNNTMRLTVEARRSAAEYGLLELVEQARSVQNAYPLNSIDWKTVKLPVLNTEILPEEAIDELKDIAEDSMRQSIRTSQGLDGFYYYRCDTELKRYWILLAPLWCLVYKYRGGMFRASISGYNLQFLKVSEPVFLGQRIIYLVGGALASIAGAVIPALASSGDNLEFPIGIILLAAIAGAYLSGKSISDVREEAWK